MTDTTETSIETADLGTDVPPTLPVADVPPRPAPRKRNRTRAGKTAADNAPVTPAARKPRAPRTRKPAATAPAEIDLQEKLTGGFLMLGTLLAGRNTVDGVIVLENAQQAGTVVAKLAEENPALKAFLSKLFVGSTLTSAVMVLGAMALPMLANHGKALPGPLGAIGNKLLEDAEAKVIAAGMPLPVRNPRPEVETDPPAPVNPLAQDQAPDLEPAPLADEFPL